MGDRTNITDARQHDAEQAAGVIERAMRNEGLIDKDVRLMGEIIAEALDAAGFDVVLRADPDTSDDLFTEARRLLDAYPEDVFPPLPDGWEPADEFDGWVDDETAVSVTPDAFAAHALRKIALPVIAALLERAVTAEADRGEAERRERTAVNLANYHRDVARTAGGRAEHAEAEARQLREAIETAESVGVDYCTLHHGIRNEDEHSCDFRDDDQESGDDGEPRECVLVELIPRPPLAVVAEGAEDRGQTDAS